MIPVNRPLLEGNEKKYLNECIDTGWISSEGPFVTRFEEEFAKKVGCAFGIAVANGTAALDVALTALNIKPGDEVVLPSFTIISCITQLVRTGAVPVVVDSDPITWNMGVSKIEEKITSKTKAIMVVHTYGLPVDMDPVLALAKKYHLKVIEDAAEAHGVFYKNKPCGSMGDISTFSFYPNKLITTGEGGMIVTNNEKLAQRCQSLRNLCFQSRRRFIHEELGWNYRMTNLQAALGVAQLEQYDRFIEKKKHIGKTYTKLLEGVDGIQLPIEQTDYATNGYWVYGIVLDKRLKLTSDQVMADLTEEGVGTRPFFYPIHQQPVLKKMGLFKKERLPVAEHLGKRGFYLPSGLGVTEKEMKESASVLRQVLKKRHG